MLSPIKVATMRRTKNIPTATPMTNGKFRVLDEEPVAQLELPVSMAWPVLHKSVSQQLTTILLCSVIIVPVTHDGMQ